jgi:hypothetical protein
VGQEIEDDIADTQGAIVDLHMFVVAGGRERSVSQYASLLHQAGLAMTATTLLPSGYVPMEAVGMTSGFCPSQAASPSEGGLFSGWHAAMRRDNAPGIWIGL